MSVGSERTHKLPLVIGPVICLSVISWKGFTQCFQLRLLPIGWGSRSILVWICGMFSDQYNCCRSGYIWYQYDYTWFQPPWLQIYCGRNLDTRIGRWQFGSCLLQTDYTLPCIPKVGRPHIALIMFLTKFIPWSIKNFCSSFPISRIFSLCWRISSFFTTIFTGIWYFCYS